MPFITEVELVTRKKKTTISLSPNINLITPEGMKLSNKSDHLNKA